MSEPPVLYKGKWSLNMFILEKTASYEKIQGKKTETAYHYNF